MRPLALLLVLAAGLVACPAASGAVARVDIVVDRESSFAHIVFEAAPGERNAVTATPAGGGGRTWLLHDDGAPLTVGVGCVALDAGTARCDPPAFAQLAALDIHAGDLDDAVTVALGPGDRSSLPLVDGGPGDDVLRSNGTLTGGAGDDTLEPTAGRW